MSRSIPVPWLRWQRFRVWGVVREEGSERPLSGLRVQAFDKDAVSDDFLGDCSNDEQGRFEIRFTDADFKDVIESQPDIYLMVFAPGRKEPIYDTSYAVRRNASQEEYYEIQIPAEKLGR
jgi:hypothetical protein